jgi:hypothetical protein
MVCRRLVGAIASKFLLSNSSTLKYHHLAWHDLHANLLQLSLDRQNDKTDDNNSSSTSSTSPADCEEFTSSIIASENDLSDTDWNHSAHASRNGKLVHTPPKLLSFQIWKYSTAHTTKRTFCRTKSWTKLWTLSVATWTPVSQFLTRNLPMDNSRTISPDFPIICQSIGGKSNLIFFLRYGPKAPENLFGHFFPTFWILFFVTFVRPFCCIYLVCALNPTKKEVIESRKSRSVSNRKHALTTLLCRYGFPKFQTLEVPVPRTPKVSASLRRWCSRTEAVRRGIFSNVNLSFWFGLFLGANRCSLPKKWLWRPCSICNNWLSFKL